MDLLSVAVELPCGSAEPIRGDWRPNEAQIAAAWTLLVELTTRVPVAPLPDGAGSDGAALSSVYRLFVTARSILANDGPDLAAVGSGTVSFAEMVGKTLNHVLRPFLTEWHPRFEAANGQLADRESVWPDQQEFRQQLRALGDSLRLFVDVLGQGTGSQHYVRQTLGEGRLGVRRRPAD